MKLRRHGICGENADRRRTEIWYREIDFGTVVNRVGGGGNIGFHQHELLMLARH